MADMKRIKGRIAETIYPNGQGAITAEAHQALLLEMVDEINSKKQDTIEGGAPFSEQGNYPDLSAGFAENLVGRGESVPAEFTFRASGGKSIKDGAARIKRIKGNSVVVNGEVVHMNTESIKSVGDNAWDEQWEKGYIDSSSGVESSSDSFIRSKNFCRIIGGEDYYIIGNGYVIVLYDENYQWLDYWGAIGEPRKVSIDSRARYFKVAFKSDYGTTYKNDVLISLYHSGWKAEKDDQYQPYWQDTLPLPVIHKYFPDGMKSAGSAHDEIRFNKASGKWEKVVRIGSVDLGTFDYNLDSRFDNAQFYCDTSSIINTNIRCGRYVTIEGGWDTNIDKTITCTSGGQILIVDSAYTDAASFKAAMQGVILYYELAEPVIREIDEPIGTDYRVADFGTEQAISSIPSAPFSADIIYQFNAVDMIRELWLKVQELESRLNNGGL